MGTINAQENSAAGFMRILVAEDDDIAAFVLQCELSKLDEPFSFQRASNTTAYLQQLRDFSPTLIIASCKLVGPALIAETRQRLPGARLVVIGADGDAPAAEQALQSGATDCLFTSRLSEIRLCLQQKPGVQSPREKSALTSGAKKFLSASKEWFREAWRETLVGWEKTKSCAAGRFATRAAGRLASHARMRWLHLKAFCTGAQTLLRARFKAPFPNGAQNVVPFGISASTANPGRTGSLRETAGEPVDLSSAARANGNGSSHLEQPRAGLLDGHDLSRFRNHGNRPETADPIYSFQVQTLQRELSQEMAAREEAESALQASEVSFKTLFESSLDSILLLDSEGSILQANSAACLLLDRPLSQLSQRKLSDFIDPAKQLYFTADWKGFLDQGFWRGEKILVLSAGKSRAVQFSLNANFWCGVHLLIARDITEPKRLSQELDELRKALAKSLEAQALQRRLLNELEHKLSWFAASAAKLGGPEKGGEAFA